MAGNGWYRLKWLEICWNGGNGRKGWKWLDMAGNGWKVLETARMADIA